MSDTQPNFADIESIKPPFIYLGAEPPPSPLSALNDDDPKLAWVRLDWFRGWREQKDAEIKVLTDRIAELEAAKK